MSIKCAQKISKVRVEDKCVYGSYLTRSNIIYAISLPPW